LLWAAWPLSPLTFIIFVGFVPLLYLADIVENKRTFFLLAFIAMLTWNVLTTWWVWNSTDVGSIAAFIANSLIMCLPWWGYRVCKRKHGRVLGYAALVLFWMGFEYIHLNWQLSWPWLTLGNVFASNPNWVQWYEYTGTSGGTLWVLLVNVLAYNLIRKYGIQSTKYEVGNAKYKVQSTRYEVRKAFPIVGIIAVPLIISWLVIPRTDDAKEVAAVKCNVLLVQPNIDPYGKNDINSINQQIQTLLALTNSKIDSATKLVVWPETAMSAENVYEDRVGNYAPYRPVYQFIQQHPNVTLVSGIQILKNYGTVKQTASATLYGDGSGFYDAFNAAVALKPGTQPAYYYKSKLVPGVETLPGFLKWMAPVFEKFGGATGGYGTQEESSVLQQPGQPYVVAPIICYESIYGEYVSTFVKKGANLLTIMTNDGWWGNTPGHKQHLQYARLRAIETRRWVARSANTGISAVIDDKGEIKETQPWDEASVIKYNIPMLTGETFYVRFGDILSKIALVLGGILLGWHWVALVRSRFGNA
jgi:apolipoprotein N-acyltransferase